MQGVKRRRYTGCGYAAFAAAFLLLCSACRPNSQDLEVVNNWDRGVVLYVLFERPGLPDQQLPLGSIQAGGTQRFTLQVAGDTESVHFRYVYRSGVFEEHADACIAADELRQSAVWRRDQAVGSRTVLHYL